LKVRQIEKRDKAALKLRRFVPRLAQKLDNSEPTLVTAPICSRAR
jgi:hypothetical protein